MARLANVFFCAAVTACLSILLTRATDHANEEMVVCPRKSHLIGSRVCKKACTQNSDCKGSKKKCVCDDVCGLTCLNPKGKCPTPYISNGKAKIGGKNKLGAVATYTCNKGYELQGIGTRICNGERQWSGVVPKCIPTRSLRDPSDLPQNIESEPEEKTLSKQVVKNCPEPPSIPFADHDGPKQNEFAPHSLVTYACRSGYASEGVAMASCLPSGLWAGPLMTCREDSCLDLGALVNGVRYGESLTVNARVNYECKRGYRLVGSPTLTCLRGGTWDHDKPTCQVSAFNTCERLRAPKYGSRLGKKLTVGSVMSFVCDTGYKLSGTAKRICQQDGTWSGSQPDCSPVDCGDPGHLWNGYIEGKKFTYSSVIKYMCFDGTKFDGLAMMATCEATGQWSFPLPRCMGSCTRPEILHAQLLLEEGRAAPISMDHGTSLTVQCSAGLVVSEPATPVCNNGTWSSLPICVQGGCDHRPKEISNGMALYRGTKYGDRVRYNCNAGYKLVGDTFLTCRNGRWEGTVPECKAVYCPHPGELTNGKVLLVGNIGKFEYRPYIRLPGQSEKIVYYCSTGYRLEGPSAATCINGMWSPDTRPKCVDNQHPMLPKTQELFTT